MAKIEYSRAAHKGPHTRETLEAEIYGLLNGYAPDAWPASAREQAEASYLSVLMSAIQDLERTVGINDAREIVARIYRRLRAVPGANWTGPRLEITAGQSWLPDDLDNATYGEAQ